MTTIILLGIFFYGVTVGHGTRCFECIHVQFPNDCTKLTVCNSDEYCFTQQMVTLSGNIVYNSGCLSKSRCSTVTTSLIGKRSTRSKRSTDITTCIECCTGDFCNIKGCGSHEIPIEKRGPYCYTCDALDPRECTNITACGKKELCMLYSPAEFSSLPDTIYRGQCESLEACNVVSQSFVNTKCMPTCCNTDFCNDRCDAPSNVTMTTSFPDTTYDKLQTTAANTTATVSQSPTFSATDGRIDTTTRNNSQTSTTPTKAHSTTTHEHFAQCNVADGFVHLQSAHAQLCVHVVFQHTPLSWGDARAECKNQGGDLIVLDTHDKALLMRKELASHSKYDQPLYWIGAKDFASRDHFSWVNGHAFHNTAADWSGGQPDHFKNGKKEDCVCMYKAARPTFKWNDKNCAVKGNFICERKLKRH